MGSRLCNALQQDSDTNKKASAVDGVALPRALAEQEKTTEDSLQRSNKHLEKFIGSFSDVSLLVETPAPRMLFPKSHPSRLPKLRANHDEIQTEKEQLREASCRAEHGKASTEKEQEWEGSRSILRPEGN